MSMPYSINPFAFSIKKCRCRIHFQQSMPYLVSFSMEKNCEIENENGIGLSGCVPMSSSREIYDRLLQRHVKNSALQRLKTHLGAGERHLHHPLRIIRAHHEKKVKLSLSTISKAINNFTVC